MAQNQCCYICDRKVHHSPKGTDREPVCLMHSKDPAKSFGDLYDNFWKEIDALVDAAGNGVACFEKMVFPELRFGRNEIQCECNFEQAIFRQYAEFDGLTFRRRANLQLAIFEQDASFVDVCFDNDADFCMSSFNGNVQFRNVEFNGEADWRACRFYRGAEFRGILFNSPETFGHAASFLLTRFAVPGEVFFDEVDLSRAIFYNCDVSKVWFGPSVKWGKHGANLGLHKTAEMYFLGMSEHADEPEILHQELQRDFRFSLQTYQQLKNNYDSRGDYWSGDETHFGEMEMRRLSSHKQYSRFPIKSIISSYLSPIALYRYASDYGNSYWKPLIWTVITLIIFAFLYPTPIAGLRFQLTDKTDTYISTWNYSHGWRQNISEEAALLGRSMIASADTAIFQKNAEYVPVYPIGHLFAIIETIMTSSLFALFLLALRRQFRR